MLKKLLLIGMLGCLFIVVIGCSSEASEDTQNNEETTGNSDENADGESTNVKQVMNWYAQPDFGGQYAALEEGYYEDAGLDMTIEPGGPETSEIQIVASGDAEFGMATGDEIIAAREKGMPIVAVAALYQKNPQVLLYHEDENIEGFEDLNGRTVYVAPGVMYWEYLKDNYNLSEVNELAFSGQFSGFLEDESSVSQAYFTTAPYNLSEQGIETDYLEIGDSGYETYANVLFTTEDKIEQNPEEVRNFVEASIQGWDFYRNNYEQINKVIQEENNALDLDGMKYSSEQLMDLVFGYDAEENGVGYMTEEKWQQLSTQLNDVGVIDSEVNAEDVFTTEFLPE